MIATIAVLAGLYFLIFKPFAEGLAELGFNFYGFTGKLILVAGSIYFAIVSFFPDMTAGWGILAMPDGATLSTQMMKTILLMTPGYALFFLVCLFKTHALIRSVIAVIFMLIISVAVSYLCSMIVGFAVLFFFLKAAVPAALGSSGRAGSSNTIICASCGATLSIPDGSSGPYTCSNCNGTTW
jgi:hypothetical protein